MLRRALQLFTLLLTGTTVAAQQIPSSGGQLQQIPPTPVQPKAAPDFQLRRPEATAQVLPAGPKVMFQSLRVTGQSLFSEGELIAVTGFQPNTELNIADLRELAARITSHYNSKGYFLAQAYVPAQDIQGGSFTIVVIEGRYGTIGLSNRSNLSYRTANGVLAGLGSGDVVRRTGPYAGPR